jgi:hypothetical protein
MHLEDDENNGLTVLIIFWVPGSDLRGGSHVLFSNRLGSEGAAVVVRELQGVGLVLCGEYHAVMHANLAVTSQSGERFMVSAYCGSPLFRKMGVL